MPRDILQGGFNMNNNDNNNKQQAAGTRLIDAEDLSWQISSITLHDVTEYIATHETSQLVPISMILEMIDKAE